MNSGLSVIPDAEAVIASVGGAPAQLQRRRTAISTPTTEDELAPGWSGHVLAPWPGRLADGEYTFEGQPHTLPWNEPVQPGGGLPGLVGWLRWKAVDVSDSSVTVECYLPPQPGYPFQLAAAHPLVVSPYGLRAVHTASNTGMRPCPLGLGVHPYLTLPGSPMEKWRLRVPAKRQLLTDERKLPTGDTQPVPRPRRSPTPSWTPPSATWNATVTASPGWSCPTTTAPSR